MNIFNKGNNKKWMTRSEFESLENHFIAYGDASRVNKMKAYMKDQFDYMGLTAPARKVAIKDVFAGFRLSKSDLLSFTKQAWESKYREMQYVAMDLLRRQIKDLTVDDMPMLESLLLNKSWWDTVDGLAVHPIGQTLKKDPVSKSTWVNRWADSDNLWLRRTAILHQLKYKDKVDLDLMEITLDKANGTSEFFLNKAIGWMLREYSRIDADYVLDFCERKTLSTLSRREALRLIS